MDEKKAYKYLGESVEKERKEEGISVKQLAKEVHITPSTYEKLKKGIKSRSLPF